MWKIQAPRNPVAEEEEVELPRLQRRKVVEVQDLPQRGKDEITRFKTSGNVMFTFVLCMHQFAG